MYKCKYVGFPLTRPNLKLNRFLFEKDLPFWQTYPQKPGRHPRSHKPVTSLQPSHVSTHFIAQFTPKLPYWHACEEISNILIENKCIFIKKIVNTYMLINFKNVLLTCFTQPPLKATSTPG